MNKILLGLLFVALLSTLAVPVNASPAPGSQNSTVLFDKSRSTPTFPPPPTNQARIYTLPVSRDIRVGQSFTVTIMLNTRGKTSSGAQASLRFNPKVLRADWVKEGTFYRSWANRHKNSTIVAPKPVINNRKGMISTGGVSLRRGGKGGPSGTGSLFVIQFTALAAGNSPLQIGNVALFSITRKQTIPVAIYNSAAVILKTIPTPSPSPTGKEPTKPPLYRSATPTRTLMRTPILTRYPTIYPTRYPMTATPFFGPPVYVWIRPSTAYAAIGETFTVTVMLYTRGLASRMGEAGLRFDPALLRADSVSEGPFYSDWAQSHAASTSFTAPTIDNQAGTISPASITIQGGSSGPTGTGTLLLIQFTALSPGSTYLTLTDVFIGDDSQPKPQPIQADLSGGQVVIGSTPTPTPYAYPYPEPYPKPYPYP